MKLTQNLKRILSAMLVLLMVFSMVPVTALAAPVRRPSKTPTSVSKPATGTTTVAPVDDTVDYLFLASYRNGNTTAIPTLINKIEETIGENALDYVGLAGDMVSSSAESYNSSTILSEITSAAANLSAVNVDIVAGEPDSLVNDDANIVLEYKNGGAMIQEGDKYYIYGVEESCVTNTSSEDFWNAQAQAFVSWANNANTDRSKVIIVLSHVPLLNNYSNNYGAYVWHQALNTVATGSATGTTPIRNVVFVQGYDHNTKKENSAPVYATLQIQDGAAASAGTIYYTYTTACALDSANHATLITINDSKIVIDFYATTGSYNSTSIIRHEHKWTETSRVDATCSTEGSVSYSCACGSTKEEVIPTEDHTYETIITDETCTTAGSVVSTCTVCGASFREDIPALGHNWKTTITQPTCAKDGSEVSVCLNCGERTVKVLPALGHNYTVTNTVEATCTTGGYTTYTCSNCSISYHGNRIAALGHSYNTVVTAPTCTTIGFTTSTCIRCSDRTVTNGVAALGHNYVATVYEAEGYVKYTCEHCQDSYQEEWVQGYTYQNCTAFSTNGSFVITLHYNNTYYALSHKNNTVTLVPVQVVDNEITSKVSEDLLWKYSNKKLYYKVDGVSHYLTAGTSSVGIATSGPATISYNSGKLKVGSKYLNISNNVLSLSYSATITYLFKQVN